MGRVFSYTRNGSPGEIRTPVDGSKARHACPLQSAKHFFPTGLNRSSRATYTFSYNFLVYINLSPMFIKYNLERNFTFFCFPSSTKILMYAHISRILKRIDRALEEESGLYGLSPSLHNYEHRSRCTCNCDR